MVHEETCDYGREREREREGKEGKKEVKSEKVCGGHDGP